MPEIVYVLTNDVEEGLIVQAGAPNVWFYSGATQEMSRDSDFQLWVSFGFEETQ